MARIVSILRRSLCRLGSRDDIEAALGNVRELSGQVWSEKVIYRFCEWFKVVEWHRYVKSSTSNGD